MRRQGFLPAACLLFLVLGGQPDLAAEAEESDALPTLEAATEGLESRRGLLDIHLDRMQGKLLLELPAPDDDGAIGDFLFTEGLVSGLGSNPVGLDRGQLGETRLVSLQLLGGRVLFRQPNLSYRAISDNPDERLAVEQSFATSVLWSSPVTARSEDGRLLIDLTSFLIRDAHGVARRLRSNEQGDYILDGDRSAIDLDNCLAFPDNVEFEALLTYAGKQPGGHVRQVTPLPEAISLVQHYSIVRLPAPGYRPREFDPREGSGFVRFMDYAQPLDAPVEQRWIVRHRLQKKRPRAERSTVVEPIVYYLDQGAPEPVRGALMDGARWWADAFLAAGFVDAFRVEMLPEGVHPLDVRYNVIQWVHRSTRGWSYGGGVVDPRTGEMIKGHVNLGSLRVRQDRLIFEGLAGTDRSGSGEADDPVQLALARIRQLAAHEVGHTLGLTHNFAASTYGRASVMDYPAPLVKVGVDGTLDFGEAYAVGAGAWDRHAIRFAYSEFPEEADERAELSRIVEEGLREGLLFVTDRDARPAGAAHPLANLWDNGEDPIAELERVMEVRRIALDGFGERNVATGRPLALLEEVLAPVYFYHRYQVDAVVKSVGGVDYRYALRGDGQPGARPVDGKRQLRALTALLDTLAPEELDLSDELLALLMPRPFGHGDNRELFNGNSAPVFDPLAAAAAASDLVLRGLLQPQRCARLVDQHRRDPALPGLEELLEALIERLFGAPESDERHGAIARQSRRSAIAGMIALSREARGDTRAGVEMAMVKLAEQLRKVGNRGVDEAHAHDLARMIDRYIERPDDGRGIPAAEPPPGSPIGAGGFHERNGCSRADSETAWKPITY